MQASIVIDNIQKWQNMKDGQPFEVIYLNTKNGSSYCAYPNTPGINLVGAGKEVVIHYKTNSWQGKEYRNAYRITPAETVSPVLPVSPVSPTSSTPPTHSTLSSPPTSSTPSTPSTQPAQQMISLLTNIKGLMETIVNNQASMIAAIKALSVSVCNASHMNAPDGTNAPQPSQSSCESQSPSPCQAPYQDQEPDQDPFEVEVGDVLPF